MDSNSISGAWIEVGLDKASSCLNQEALAHRHGGDVAWVCARKPPTNRKSETRLSLHAAASVAASTRLSRNHKLFPRPKLVQAPKREFQEIAATRRCDT